MEKTCSKCNVKLSINNFYVRRNRPSGYTSSCKKCIWASTNKEKMKIRNHSWRSKNHTKVQQYQQQWRNANKSYIKACWMNNKDRSKELAKIRNINIKNTVFNKYGKSCNLCNISDINILCIDHINNGGTKHRKQTGSGTSFYRWLLKNNLPDGYQVLCMNCNALKSLQNISKLRMAAIHHYSNGSDKCKICKIDIIALLCIDHIDGGGRKQRAKLGIHSIHKWLKSNQYPSGFQVLCYNCNFNKHFRGKDEQ